MALSGSKRDTVVKWWYLDLVWRVTERDPANNRSKIRVEAWWEITGGGYNLGSSRTGSITIAGNKKNISYTPALGNGQPNRKRLGFHERWVNHGSDGTLKPALSMSIPINLTLNGVYVGTRNVSLTPTVDPYDVGGGLWLKVSGSWRKAQLWLKVSGSWRKAQLWTKVSGTWRKGR